MTTDLEKQFFDTFGIEPKPLFSTRNGITDDKYIYPTITDRILLELICIISSRIPLFGRAIWQEYLFDNVEDLKRGTLIILMGNMSEYNTLDYKEAIKHQVRTLFEEG